MLKQIYKKIIIVSLVIMIITYVTSLFFEFKVFKILLGMLVGTVLSILRIYMLNKSINRVVEMDKSNAQKVGALGYTVRYLITGVVLVMLVLYSVGALLGAAAIIIIVTKIAIYTTKIEDGDKSKLVDFDEDIKKN